MRFALAVVAVSWSDAPRATSDRSELDAEGGLLSGWPSVEEAWFTMPKVGGEGYRSSDNPYKEDVGEDTRGHGYSVQSTGSTGYPETYPE